MRFICASRTLVPSLLDLVSQQAARIAELEGEAGHERDHSKMLSEANSALHVEKRAIENYCGKVRGEYTTAATERDQLRSQLATVTRERDEAIADGVLSQRVCDIENENAQLRGENDSLRRLLREACEIAEGPLVGRVGHIAKRALARITAIKAEAGIE